MWSTGSSDVGYTVMSYESDKQVSNEGQRCPELILI